MIFDMDKFRVIIMEKIINFVAICCTFIVTFLFKVRGVFFPFFLKRFKYFFFKNTLGLLITQFFLLLFLIIIYSGSFVIKSINFVFIYLNFYNEKLRRYSIFELFNFYFIKSIYFFISILRKRWVKFAALIEEPPIVVLPFRGNNKEFFIERYNYSKGNSFSKVISYLYFEKEFPLLCSILFIQLKKKMLYFFLLAKELPTVTQLNSLVIYTYYKSEIIFIFRNILLFIFTYNLYMVIIKYKISYVAALFHVFPDTVTLLYYYYYPAIFFFWFSLIVFIIIYMYFVLSRKVRNLDFYPEKSGQVEAIYDDEDSSMVPEYLVHFSIVFYIFHWILLIYCMQGHIFGFTIWWDNQGSIFAWDINQSEHNYMLPSKWAAMWHASLGAVVKFFTPVVGNNFFGLFLVCAALFFIFDFLLTLILDDRPALYIADLVVEEISYNITSKIFGYFKSLSFFSRLWYRFYNLFRVYAFSYKYETKYRWFAQKVRRLVEYDYVSWKLQISLQQKSFSYLNLTDRIVETRSKVLGYQNIISYINHGDVPRDLYRWFDKQSCYFVQMNFEGDNIRDEDILIYSPELKYEYCYPIHLYDDYHENVETEFFDTFCVEYSVGATTAIKTNINFFVMNFIEKNKMQLQLQKDVSKDIVPLFKNYYVSLNNNLFLVGRNNDAISIVSCNSYEAGLISYIKELLYTYNRKFNKYKNKTMQKNLKNSSVFTVPTEKNKLQLFKDLLICSRYETTYYR